MKQFINKTGEIVFASGLKILLKNKTYFTTTHNYKCECLIIMFSFHKTKKDFLPKIVIVIVSSKKCNR